MCTTLTDHLRQFGGCTFLFRRLFDVGVYTTLTLQHPGLGVYTTHIDQRLWFDVYTVPTLLVCTILTRQLLGPALGKVGDCGFSTRGMPVSVVMGIGVCSLVNGFACVCMLYTMYICLNIHYLRNLTRQQWGVRLQNFAFLDHDCSREFIPQPECVLKTCTFDPYEQQID